MLFDIVLALTLSGAPMPVPSLRRDDPAPEPLPPPRFSLPEDSSDPIMIGPAVLPYERINRYDVWHYVAADRLGRFRPRVIYSPQGAYYLFNGAPYPFTTTRTLDFMPYATP